MNKVLYVVGGLLVVALAYMLFNVSSNVGKLDEKVNFLAAGSGETMLGGTTNFDALELGGALTVTGNQTVGGTLGVTGASTFTGAQTFNGASVFNTSMGFATSSPTSDFDIYGFMRVYPTGTGTSTCDATTAGALMYSTGTVKVMGCDGSNWNALW